MRLLRLPSLLLLFALPVASAPSRANPAAPDGEPVLIRVALDDGTPAERLIEAGLDVIELRRGRFADVLALPADRATLERLGVTFSIADPAPGRTWAARSRAELAGRPRAAGTTSRLPVAAGVYRTQVVPPIGSGSFAGFWSFDEAVAKMQEWVDNDLNDVVANQLDSLGSTVQGRTVWGLRLGSTVAGPDTRPVVFFNSLTHAREPAGMHALLYFVDDLLAKYGSDPTATYLLDQRVIYVVPIVNPDGYELNRQTWVNSGGSSFGLHRKNLRDTNNNGLADLNTDGVDLNRNYSFQWSNPGGSSTTPSDGTYRGPSAFSEPETQIQRDLVASLAPKTGLSFHSYSDLYLHPWGYTPDGTPDSLAFYEWSDDMVAGNGYQTGQGVRLLYAVSGEFTDWCYGETTLKPRMFAWTPEVGAPADGFWPAPSRILPLARENLRPCYYVAAIAGPYVRVERSALVEGALARGSIAHLTLRARNRGASGQAGPGLAASLASLSAGAHVIQGTIPLPTLGSFQSGDPLHGQTFTIAADDTVTLGRLLSFEVSFNAPDGFFSRDTVTVPCGAPLVLFADNADGGLGNWSATGGWAIGTGDPFEPDAHFTESPGGLHGNNTNAVLTLALALDLSRASHAYLLMENRWDFESDYDFGIVEARISGPNWIPLVGRGTSAGVNSGVQIAGAPLFDGTRKFWFSDRLDLSPLAGPTSTSVDLRLRVRTDSGANFDGFRVDSIRVISFDPNAQPTPVAVETAPPGGLALSAPAPQPARSRVRLSFDVPRRADLRVEVLDLQGRHVRTLARGSFAAGRYAHGWDLNDERSRPVPSGVYLVRLTDGAIQLSRRIVVVR